MIGIAAGGVVYFWLSKRRSERPLPTLLEYWVYLPKAELPQQDLVMARAMREGPYSAILGTQEGLVFSDIRLHVALVLRDRNPHVFRPDLFDSSIIPTPDALDGLSRSAALAKVRFVSEDPVANRAYLRLLPHLVLALLDLAEGLVVFDLMQESLYSVHDFRAQIQSDPKADSAASHVRALWRDVDDHGEIESRGLAKIGRHDFRTEPISRDQKTLTLQVMDEYLAAAWQGEFSEVEVFGDRFRIELGEVKAGKAKARILRLQTADRRSQDLLQ